MQAGDSYRFLDETGGGMILETDGRRVLVLTDDGFEHWVETGSIVVIPQSSGLNMKKGNGATTQPANQFAPGTTVHFFNEPGSGVVLKLEDDKVHIRRDDDFEQWFSHSELVPVHKEILDVMSRGPAEPKDRAERKHRPQKSKQREIWEVDLHMSELLDSDRHMSDYEKLMYQLEMASSALNNARRQGFKKVILIHGVGKGRLRSELEFMLQGMEKLRFYDAPLQKYGRGATEVEFF